MGVNLMSELEVVEAEGTGPLSEVEYNRVRLVKGSNSSILLFITRSLLLSMEGSLVAVEEAGQEEGSVGVRDTEVGWESVPG